MDSDQVDQRLANANADELALLIRHRNNVHPPAEVPLLVVNLGLRGTFNYWGAETGNAGYVMADELRERLTQLAQSDLTTAERAAS